MKLTVVFVNNWRNRIALEFENCTMPQTFRTVHIELTPEQLKQIEPAPLGISHNKPVTEEIYNSWLEP